MNAGQRAWCTVVLQWGLSGSYNKQSYNRFLYLQILELFVVGSYQTSTVTVLYLVSLLFAIPILHPANYFHDREVLIFFGGYQTPQDWYFYRDYE